MIKHNNTEWYTLYTQKEAMLRSLNETLMTESKF